MIDDKTKREIDSMTYEKMLRLWRFAPLGDPMFQGETGQYFSEVMKEKKSKLTDCEHVRVSKLIGWERY